MIESEEKGYRFYRERKKTLPVIVILAVLVVFATAIFFIFFKGKDRQQDVNSNAGAVNAQDTALVKIPADRDEGGKQPGTERGDSASVGSKVDNSAQEAIRALYEAEARRNAGMANNPNSDNRDNEGGAVTSAGALADSCLNMPKTGNTAADTLFNQGCNFYLKRNYSKALEYYRQVLPGDKKALLYAGLCCYQLENYREAVTYFKDALDYNLLDFIALKFITLTYYKLDDLPNTRKYAKYSLEAMTDPEIQRLTSQLKEEQNVMTSYGVTDTDKFKVFFSKEEHADIERGVLDILNEAYRVIGREIDFYPSAPVTVILYNEKAFFDVTRSPGWAGGLYDGKIRIPIGGFDSVDQGLLKEVLFHEFAHALVHAVTPQCPRWLNEGLALYFSPNKNSLPKIGQVLPLDTLETSFPLAEDQANIAYLESYSAVSFLVERYRIFRIKELLTALAAGEDMKSAFSSALLVPYERFCQTWGKE